MRTSHPLAITQETDSSMTTLLSLAAALFYQTRHSHSVKTRSDEAASGKYFKTRYFNRKGHKFNEEATFLWRAGFLLLQMLLLGPYSWDLCKVASFLCVASFSFKVLKTFSILFLCQFSEFPQPVRLCDARRFAQPRQVQQDNPGLQAEAEGECGLHLRWGRHYIIIILHFIIIQDNISSQRRQRLHHRPWYPLDPSRTGKGLS